jgi:D-alanyl-D-alanine dipeptidase
MLLPAREEYMRTSSLPDGFVYLNEFDDTIRFDIRYSGFYNIFERPLVGYQRNVPITTLQAAKAIANAQREFMKDGFSILIYDAYRPLAACKDMVVWSKEEVSLNLSYFPDFTSRRQIFEEHYISENSSHCRGSTIDATIIKLEQAISIPSLTQRKIDGKIIPFYYDGSVDMGTSFDFMGLQSHSNYLNISNEQKKSRQYLIKILENFGMINNAQGWTNGPQEWWHFTLANEPFKNTYFDFVVK